MKTVTMDTASENREIPRSRKSGLAGTCTRSVPNHPQLKIYDGASMSLFTTWRIGGPADFLVRTPTPGDLVATIEWAGNEGLPVTVIGGGSNLLVGDRGIRGLVIVSRTPGERSEHLVNVEDHGDHVELRVGAQALLSWVGRYCAERGWGGMDWGVGLPGTIGGATVNNAGAHGTELKDNLVGVVAINNNGKVANYDREWLAPRYRHTSLKDSARPRPFNVLESIFRLPKTDPVELVRLATEHADYRHETQPTGACAGSTFTNPDGDFAGRLLEGAGMKGFAVGGVSFSTKHSNFIVNDGSGTAAHVRELIASGKRTVRERFDIELEAEIEEIGEF